MATPRPARTRAFISYSHADSKYLAALQRHLKPLLRESNLHVWDDTQIEAGDNWREEIEQALASARVAILLVSAHFLASDFISGEELPRLLAAAKDEGARILLVILSPSVFKHTKLSQFQAINDPIRPLAALPDYEQEEVWVRLAEMVYEALAAALSPPPIAPAQPPQPAPVPQKTKEDWLKEGDALVHYRVKRSVKALACYEQALALDPSFARALSGKAEALNELKRYQEGLAAAERAIQLNPKDARAQNGRGDALYGLKRYEEALTAFERATQLNPQYAYAYHNKGTGLASLKRYEEALVALERAIQLDPQDARTHISRGTALYYLKRYEEALVAYEWAIQLDPQLAITHSSKGAALSELKRYEEALVACERAIQLDPQYAAAYNNKGYALRALGRTAEAEQAWQKARELGG